MVEFLTYDSVLSLLPVLLYTVEPPADRLVGTFTVNRFQSTVEMKQRGLLTTFVCVCTRVCVLSSEFHIVCAELVAPGTDSTVTMLACWYSGSDIHKAVCWPKNKTTFCMNYLGYTVSRLIPCVHSFVPAVGRRVQ